MTRPPKKPRSPQRKHRKHENGVFTFSDTQEGWQPTPTPAEAHARFAEIREHWKRVSLHTDFTAQLIVCGEVADEIVVRAEPAAT